MSAGTGFTTGKGSCFSDGTTQEDENFNIFSALWTFYFHQAGRSLTFLTSVDQHSSTSPNKGDESVLHPLPVLRVSGQFPGQQVFLVFQPDNNNCRIAPKGDQRIPGTQHQRNH